MNEHVTQVKSRIPQNEYPFESHFAQVGSHQMHYLDEGQGPVVVMVHGNPSWSFYYRKLVGTLSKTHRCIVPDHIGCGLSDKPSDDTYAFTLEQRISDLDELLKQVCPNEQVVMVVHDWGGMIGTSWATQHNDRIRALVVLNTAAFHMPSDKALPWQLYLARNTSLGSLLVRGLNAFSVGASVIGCTRKPMSSEIKKAYQAPYDSWNNRIATLRFVQDIPLEPGDSGYDIVSQTSDALTVFGNTPTFIGWGLKDVVFDETFLRVWKEKFPHATTVEIPDGGHYILEDAPEIMLPAVEKFITEL